MPKAEHEITEFSSIIRQRRSALGLTQAQLARAINYERSTIARIEHGDFLPTDQAGVERLAEALNLPAGTLLPLYRIAKEARAAESAGREEARSATLVHEQVAYVWDRFPYEVAMKAIAQANHLVFVWQTWIPDFQPFLAPMAKALESGAEIRCLILDPGCAVARLRATALGFDVHYPRTLLAKLQAELTTLAGTPDRDVLRISSDLPAIQAYGTERVAFVGWYWPGSLSLTMPQVEVSTSSSPLGRSVLESFNSVWERSSRSTSGPTKGGQ